MALEIKMRKIEAVGMLSRFFYRGDSLLDIDHRLNTELILAHGSSEGFVLKECDKFTLAKTLGTTTGCISNGLTKLVRVGALTKVKRGIYKISDRSLDIAYLSQEVVVIFSADVHRV